MTADAGAAPPAAGTAHAGGDDVVVTPAALRAWALPIVDGDKETRGRLLVVGGSAETPGAVLLAAEAALRAGAGKLQVATVASVAPHLAVAVPEARVVALPETAGEIDAGAAARIVELGQPCDAVLLGPGIGQPAAAAALLADVVPHLGRTVVIDALGMGYLTTRRDGVAHLAGRAVLSPNVVELAHTLEVDVADVEGDTRPYVGELARQTGAIVVSGTATTWVARPDGTTWRVEAGGPGLGASGSGDVKAGVLAGLCVRVDDPAQAAVWAAYAHGRAGERLAAAVGTVGYLARELVAEIPRVLSEV